MAVRKRAPVASTARPLRETLIPSVNILYKNCTAITAGSGGEKNQDVEGSTVAGTTLPSAPTAITTDEKEDEISEWVTSPDLIWENLSFTPDIMYNLNNFLLGNPNMNSPHLFRADIWFDSAGQLKTPKQKEKIFEEATIQNQSQSDGGDDGDDDHAGLFATAKTPSIPGFELKRRVIRELIPRRPQLDRALKQTCLYYEGVAVDGLDTSGVHRALYLFMPDVKGVEDVPFYHPRIRGWGFLYDYDSSISSCGSSQVDESEALRNGRKRNGEGVSSSCSGTLSLHILPFPETEGFDPFPVRLERILQNLLTTHVRLARNTRPAITTTTTSPTNTSDSHTTTTTGKKQDDDSYNPDKDNIIPRHMVQNTYARLKATYSQDLCKRWVENTEPAKHVFEDLAITAFLIELWRNMYGVVPNAENLDRDETSSVTRQHKIKFPGFVDIACGNGVLVYVLLSEGYTGWGFDARRRKTWSIFPDWVQQNLEEAIYIPQPFASDFMSTATTGGNTVTVPPASPGDRILNHNGIKYTTGTFPKETFIISNHADELTVWTPILAALASPEEPLPFLSIPCCSHALSGARYRYKPPKTEKPTITTTTTTTIGKIEEETITETFKTGDLKALHAQKLASCTARADCDPNSSAVLNSMYGSLTAKTMSVAAEVGFGADVERTLLRIPSTRNMGVVGGRRNAILKRQQQQQQGGVSVVDAEAVRRAVKEVVERECAMDGGVGAAARIWIDRAMGLQKPGKK